MLIKNIVVNKITVLLINLLIFNKKYRRKLRKKVKDIFAQSQIDKIQDEFKDYYIFSLFFPWGDLGIACALMKEFKKQNGGKILVLVNSQNRAKVTELFSSVDKVLVIGHEIYDYIYQNPNPKPEKGHYFEVNHWKFYDAPRYNSENFLELYANMLGVKNYTDFERPVFDGRIKSGVLKTIEKLKIDISKTVLISPDANSFNSELVDSKFWIEKAGEYTKQGYTVVFNSKSWEYRKYKRIFLPMDETLYFCTLCKKIIALRSGFNDLLALTGGCNLEIYYPESIYFTTVEPIMQLVEFKRAFKDEPDKTFQENMFRITSLKMFGTENLEEILLKDSKDGGTNQ